MQPMPQSRAEYDQDRRWHIRYPVCGTAHIEAGGSRYQATPLEISLGGVTFKTDQLLPVNQRLTLTLDIYGFGELIRADIKFIRADSRKATAIFLVPESSLARCIAWIASYDNL